MNAMRVGCKLGSMVKRAADQDWILRAPAGENGIGGDVVGWSARRPTPGLAEDMVQLHPTPGDTGGRFSVHINRGGRLWNNMGGRVPPDVRRNTPNIWGNIFGRPNDIYMPQGEKHTADGSMIHASGSGVGGTVAISPRVRPAYVGDKVGVTPPGARLDAARTAINILPKDQVAGAVRQVSRGLPDTKFIAPAARTARDSFTPWQAVAPSVGAAAGLGGMPAAGVLSGGAGATAAGAAGLAALGAGALGYGAGRGIDRGVGALREDGRGLSDLIGDRWGGRNNQAAEDVRRKYAPAR